ncbi:uncharacterized protein B0I36DRAFT_311475 [Microdochium trichocladiopsis]|uniref:Uncharacterized protein n=1 Tax=Microdochium trichocladiopsis TaxID=1682393 RepID=A0A9P8YIU6_9PEZI|nr:uncharacterized protein B0I36DRAFT_311475 [Microdochium trichocladiopsis]KAH7040792.1 hypothetical protein B0I36DRAFT_311475 [Microdochium trichocladiopsis]
MRAVPEGGARRVEHGSFPVSEKSYARKRSTENSARVASVRSPCSPISLLPSVSTAESQKRFCQPGGPGGGLLLAQLHHIAICASWHAMPCWGRIPEQERMFSSLEAKLSSDHIFKCIRMGSFCPPNGNTTGAHVCKPRARCSRSASFCSVETSQIHRS